MFNNYKLYILLFCLISAICISACLAEKNTLETITEKTGITSWVELESYLEETFISGMSKAGVRRELETLGDYSITPTKWGTAETSCEIINIPAGRNTKLQYLACYSVKDNVLVSWSLDD